LVTSIERWSFVVVLGACQGKTEPAEGPAEPVAPPPAEVQPTPAKAAEAVEPTGEPKGPRVQPRRGFIEATLDGKKHRFEVLPAAGNHVAAFTRQPVARITALPTEDATERMLVLVQEFDLAQSLGRELHHRKTSNGVKTAVVLYTDPEGISYHGRIVPGGEITMTLHSWEPNAQRLTGGFSGVLMQSRGTRKLEVEAGTFSTELVPAP
jgi:hypothetical protein